MAEINLPTLTVEGIIYDEFNAPLGNVIIKVFDKDLRSEQLLGEAFTNDKGQYLIQYTAARFARAEKSAADIFIKVFSQSTSTINRQLKKLGESSVHFNVAPQYTLDFKVDGTAFTGISEFDALKNRIIPLLKGQRVKLHDLTGQDIDFLSKETTINASIITFLSLAAQHVKSLEPIKNKIPVDVFYGLLRLQLPNSLNELFLVQSDSIEKGIKEALKKNIISTKWDKELPAIIKEFNRLSLNFILESKGDDNVAFQTMISSSIPTKQLREAFVDSYFSAEKNPEKIWDELALRPGFEDGTIIKSTQKVLQLNLLTGHPVLAAQLHKQQKKDVSLSDVRAYAKFTAKDFEKHITDAEKTGALKEFLKGVEGKTKKQKIKNHADQLEDTVSKLFPTDVFRHQMSADNENLFNHSKNDMVTFLGNNPDFDLKTTKINKLFKEASFRGIRNTNRIKDDLKKINRINKLAPNYKNTHTIIKAGMDSAVAIVAKSETEFVKAVQRDIPANIAKLTYRQAVSTNNRTMTVAMDIKSKQDNSVYAINGSGSVSPDYQTMFGDNNLCNCVHCQSVYSPSAYFVDMLSFIKENSANAYNKLVKVENGKRRRPDLIQVLLTCNNTNTVLPYIDLVNEILESQIALSSSTALQTTLTATELSAFPEHVNTDTYKALASDFSSFKLPFNLPLIETRIYLYKLDCQRYQLMELFYSKQANSQYSDINIAAEYLGLSSQELSNINGEEELEGVQNSTEIENYLTLTSLSYVELLQVLECEFVNPTDVNNQRTIKIKVATDLLKEDGVTPIVIDETSCNVKFLRLKGFTLDLLKNHLRFIRLWKKLDWDVLDLDRVLIALSINQERGITNTLLVALSNLVRLKTAFKLNIPQLLSFWSDLPTQLYVDHSTEEGIDVPSLYHNLFQNKAISNPLDADFSDPNSLLGSLSDKSEIISAALSIDANDFDLLTEKLISNDDLSLSNLSHLYRHALLAKILKLNITELLLVLNVTGLDPFTVTNETFNTLDFIDVVFAIKNSGFSLQELASLVKTDTNILLLLDVNATTAVLTALREGLQGIAELQAENTVEENQKQLAAQKLIIDSLSSTFNADAGIIEIMLTEMVKSTVDNQLPTITQFTASAFIEKTEAIASVGNNNEVIWLHPDLVDSYLLLNKTWNRLSLLLDTLSISADEFIYLQSNEAALDLAGIWNLSKENVTNQQFERIIRLIKLIQFRDSLIQPTEDWYLLFESAIAPNASRADFDASFELLTGISTETQTFSANKLNYSFPEDFLMGENLSKILACNNKAKSLGGTVETIFTLADSTESEETSSIAKNLLKIRYDDNAWLDIIKPISNQLRSEKRDALLSYLLNSSQTEDFRGDHNIFNSNDVFAHFLIDIEMAPCMMTSRIKQAISSVQLYIDRCLMGLENNIVFNNDFVKEWNEWRKIYRVWEANRKVFLYPENWIEPELRDDKSPFFKELESKLTQNEVTDEAAKDALLEYLDKLDTVANLEIIAFFDDTATKINHVIGRTKNIPHQYFYRKQQKSIWTAWEKMELDIQGDHILLVVWNNRLMVFWGEFTEKQRSKNKGISLTIPEGGLENGGEITSSDSPHKYLEMKLNWSTYTRGSWKAKKVSEEKAEIGRTYSDPSYNKKQIVLSSKVAGEKLYIRLVIQKYSYPITLNMYDDRIDDTFCFNTFNSKPYITTVDAEDLFLLMGAKGLKPDSMFLNNGTTNNFSIYKTGLYKAFLTNEMKISIFNNVSEAFQLLPNHHEIEKNKPTKFFFNNAKNTFYVEPRQKLIKDIFIDDMQIPDLMMARRFNEPSPIGTFVNNTATLAFEVNSNTIANSFPNLEVAPSPTNNNISFKRAYHFQTFYHPFVCEYMKALNTHGIDALYQEDTQNKDDVVLFTANKYAPDGANVKSPYPVEKVDFEFNGTYSLYNWELFYHIPLLIASRLSQNQKFDDARKWFHYIFDPTQSSLSADKGIERFWSTKPFKQEIKNGLKPIEELLNDKDSENDLSLQLENWASDPFNPHAVARLRNSAYMRSTLMKYIDNLVDWGDQLFRRDSIESINEATQLYILAANLLGEKPENIPARAEPTEVSFDTIKEELDLFSNAKVLIESFISPSEPNEDDSSSSPVLMPLFCLPKNKKLLSYWDNIADKLFKIRHCMNIEGVVRQLPLFEPPIDPALLVRAKAAGLDLNTVLNDIQSVLPHYRFQVMLQKANELCNDVKSLGSQLLATLEKKDAEELSLLRSGQEIKLLELIRDIKKLQVNESKESLKDLHHSLVIIEERKNYYDNKEYLNPSERSYFNSTKLAINLQTGLELKNYLASVAAFSPDFKVGSGFTLGTTFGGKNLSMAEASATNAIQSVISLNKLQAESSNMQGGFERRQDDWKFQTKTATLELKQIDKQILAAEIRLAISEKDLNNHEVQMEQSQKVREYMQSKFSNFELYDHMVKQISGLYFQTYQMAYDLAKKAERCYQFELGLQKSNVIKYGHWDNLKQGLLAGEHLQFDLRRLESAFLENNTRTLELSKHISLKLLNPLAFISLKETGKSTLFLPEELFDLDFQGHYFRRIKSMSITIPCVTGPYSGVNCTLRLIKNSTRINTLMSIQSGIYEHENDEGLLLDDDRFQQELVPVTSIATSSAQNDNGLFEFNFRDERYLPFEGSGVISTWELELSDPELQQFDYSSISDVLLHINYTAKDGGNEFKEAAVTYIKKYITTDAEQSEQPLIQMISIKNEFSTEWHKFLHPVGEAQNLKITIDKNRFPFFTKGRGIDILKLDIFARSNQNNNYQLVLEQGEISSGPIVLEKDTTPIYGELHKSPQLNKNIFSLKIDEKLSIGLTRNNQALTINPPEIEDLLFVLHYKFSP